MSWKGSSTNRIGRFSRKGLEKLAGNIDSENKITLCRKRNCFHTTKCLTRGLSYARRCWRLLTNIYRTACAIQGTCETMICANSPSLFDLQSVLGQSGYFSRQETAEPLLFLRIFSTIIFIFPYFLYFFYIFFLFFGLESHDTHHVQSFLGGKMDHSVQNNLRTLATLYIA